MSKKLFIGVALLLAVRWVAAQTGGGFDLSWSSLEGGGYSNGGGFEMTGSVGQPDAGRMSEGGFTLDGGFQAVEAGLVPVELSGVEID